METRTKKSKTGLVLSGAFVLGRQRFEKFSAVEGLKLRQDAAERLEAMERAGVPADERRRVIAAHHEKSA